MRKGKNVVWGLILIAVGVIMAGNALNLFDINVFFSGWWTLFIIIPSLFGIAGDKDKTGSIIALIIGVLLLLSCQKLIDFEIIWKLLIPIIIVGIGLSLIFKNSFNKEFKKVDASKDEVFATFSGQDVKVTDEFKGTNLNAIFGGIKLDLRDAKIKQDVVINTTSIFGGIEINVPEGMKVKVSSTSIFGGVDEKKLDSKVDEKGHTIYINATCIFGGVEVK